MPEIHTKVIDESEHGMRSVLKTDKKQPFFVGKGDTTYFCGNCGFALAETLFRGQVRNIVFLCPRCGVFSEICPLIKSI